MDYNRQKDNFVFARYRFRRYCLLFKCPTYDTPTTQHSAISANYIIYPPSVNAKTILRILLIFSYNST